MSCFLEGVWSWCLECGKREMNNEHRLTNDDLRSERVAARLMG